MINRNLENTLSDVFARSKSRHHEFITIEHLLLGLLDNPEALCLLKTCQTDVSRLQATLDIFIEETTPRYASLHDQSVQPTQGFHRVLQRAIDQVRAVGVGEVSGASLLVSIYGEPESQAVYFLNQENVLFSDVMNALTQAHFSASTEMPKQQNNLFDESSRDFSFSAEPMIPPSHLFMKEKTVNGLTEKEQELVAQYTENLNERAKSSKIDPLIGRQAELERCVQILCRRRKNNPIFVGEAGVGKTAIAEGLALRIVSKDVPEALESATVYALDLASLLSGTKYRGDFEKRFKAVLKALGKENDAIIFIDEIHNLVGAGAATGSTMDASNLMKPMLSSGDIRCMGATTYEEYRQHIEKDNALLRRFQKIDVLEPSNEEALKIVEGLRGQLEKYHDIIYSDAALQCAIDLSARYIVDRQLPDKAIDVLDEAGAHEQLKPLSRRQQLIDARQIEKVVAKMARIPVEKITEKERDKLKTLSERLKAKVFGQDKAIEALSDAIKLSQSGLKDPDKPVGSFLFSGPTGVGKTEVVKQLATELNLSLIRFDMSEYMERHTVSRLIGAPPGYVGHDQAGLLTEAIMKQPHAVLLLDEVEKAHPDLFNILLQVMDYGFLTDNNGRKADFRHVMIIMTSNVGAEIYEKKPIGFSNVVESSDTMGAIKQLFSPEFRNRLDGMVSFAPLDESVILKVVDNNLRELSERLTEQGVYLEVSQEAKTWLAERGYDSAMGARPMARLIKEKLMLPLANQLLFTEKDRQGNTIWVDIVGDELTLSDMAAVSDEVDA